MRDVIVRSIIIYHFFHLFQGYVFDEIFCQFKIAQGKVGVVKSEQK